jgi:hypothetical protein
MANTLQDANTNINNLANAFHEYMGNFSSYHGGTNNPQASDPSLAKILSLGEVCIPSTKPCIHVFIYSFDLLLEHVYFQFCIN